MSEPHVNEPAVELSAVTGRIDGRTVVDHVDLTVHRGELLALVGPSGCGKSTLLRVVAGLHRDATGAVHLDGRDVTRLPPERRRVGLVFQDHALFPHLTVAANVAFGLWRRPAAEQRHRVTELLELVHLGTHAERYPHELSGGEQQRVALARALAPEPAVVLLDEPFASLDATLRDELRLQVRAALRTAGATAILVTHDRDEALGLGDRVAVMQDGRLVQVADPDQVFRRPASRFVAALLGPAGFLAAQRVADGSWRTALGPVSVIDPSGHEPAADSVELLVRPHDLSVCDGDAAEVVDRRYTGGGYRYELATSEGVRLFAAGDGEGPGEVGDRVGLQFAHGRPLVAVPA